MLGWIKMVQNKVQWWAFVNTLASFRVNVCIEWGKYLYELDACTFLKSSYTPSRSSLVTGLENGREEEYILNCFFKFHCRSLILLNMHIPKSKNVCMLANHILCNAKRMFTYSFPVILYYKW
jgi:hypothetical protein